MIDVTGSRGVVCDHYSLPFTVTGQASPRKLHHRHGRPRATHPLYGGVPSWSLSAAPTQRKARLHASCLPAAPFGARLQYSPSGWQREPAACSWATFGDTVMWPHRATDAVQ